MLITRSFASFARINPTIGLITPKCPEYEDFLHIFENFQATQVEQVLFIAKLNRNLIVGGSHATLDNKVMRIGGVKVIPRMQNQGIGTQILKSMFSWGAENGAQTALIALSKEQKEQTLFKNFQLVKGGVYSIALSD